MRVAIQSLLISGLAITGMVYIVNHLVSLLPTVTLGVL